MTPLRDTNSVLAHVYAVDRKQENLCYRVNVDSQLQIATSFLPQLLHFKDLETRPRTKTSIFNQTKK